MPTDLPPDYRPPAPRMLDAKRYLDVLRRLLRRSAGPVGILWALATMVIIAVSIALASQAVQFFHLGDSPDRSVVIALVVVVLVADIFRKALYLPLSKLGDEEYGATGFAEALRGAAGAMIPVALTHMATTALLIGAAVICAIVGVFAIIPIIIFSFVLAPAIYFAATGRGVGTAIGGAIDAARRHGPWILGVPAIFTCVATLFGSLSGVSSLLLALQSLATTFDGGALHILQMVMLSLLYGYMRWICVGSVYVAVDEQ